MGNKQLIAAKILAAIIALGVFLGVVLAMAKWDDFPGVMDNICYLRQAHLFERFGLRGIDTDLQQDDVDGWLANYSRANGFACHHFAPATGKTIMQYPPGTGYLLSLFPDGVRTASLYVACTSAVFLFACAAIRFATSLNAVCISLGVSLVTLYFMVNPARSSDSMAPTMTLCCLCGLLTAWMLWARNRFAALTAAGCVGLLLGIAFDVRVPNLLLAGGYFALFALEQIVPRWRKPGTLAAALAFGSCALIGLTPTLAANYINSGSPFTFGYRGADVAMPDVSLGHIVTSILQFLPQNQGIMLAIALVLTVGFQRLCDKSEPAIRTQTVLISNLIINMAFYITHPIFTPYYAMGIATLTVWTALFCYVQLPAQGQVRLTAAKCD